MIKVAQAKSLGAVHTHTDSSLVKSVVENNTTFICGVQKKSMCNVIKYNKIIFKILE